jgi:hypothetical protein
VGQIQGIDTVNDVVDDDYNFVTVQVLREAEMVGNDQFIDREDVSVEGNHVHGTCQMSVCAEDVMFEVGQSSHLHRYNNYKGDEFGNNNVHEMDVADNGPNFQTYSTVHSALNNSDDTATVFGHAIKLELNKAGDRIPENNNDLGLELKDAQMFCSISKAPSVVLGNDGNNVVFEYSGRVEKESYKRGLNIYMSNEEFGSTEIEGMDSCSSVDEIGIDPTDLINGSKIHLPSNGVCEASSCSDLNIDLTETGPDRDTEILFGQNEHSFGNFTFETLPTDNLYFQNLMPETEDDIHNGRGTVNSHVTTADSSSVDLDGSVEQFLIAGNCEIINCNSEIHTIESDNPQGLDMLQSNQETDKFCVKTMFKKGIVADNRPVVGSLEHFNYGSTENKDASLLNDKIHCNSKSDTKLKKPLKNKKKEPHIT